RGIADVAADQVEEAIRAAREQAMAPELEGVQDPNAMALLQQHRDQCRGDVTGSAGDEYPHRRLHPWCSRRAWNVECGVDEPGGKARRASQHARPSSLRPFSVVLLRAGSRDPRLGLSCRGDTIAKSRWSVNAILPGNWDRS